MFSKKEKIKIAKEIEELLLSFYHPEMPAEKPMFRLHVDGKEDWSFADIEPNWLFEEKGVENPNGWNEVAREKMK